MRLLFIGRGGSGKTYLAKYFKKRGKNAINADSYPGLSRWEDKHGNVVRNYNIKTWDKSLGIDWFWNPKVLKNLAKKNDLYLFGYARNTIKYVGLFDRVYLLDVNEKVRRQRLKARRDPWGKTEAQIKDILKGAMHLRRLAKRKRVKIIDAILPPEKIFKIVEADRKL